MSTLSRMLPACSLVLLAALGCTPTLSQSGPPKAPSRDQLRPDAGEAALVLKKLYNLPHRTGRHSTPDAIVAFMSDLDRRQPLHLIVYNHGLTNNLNEALDDWNLTDAFKQAPKNTVIVLPEWAQHPEAFSSAAGQFHRPGFFRAMLNETLQRTPQLNGLTAEHFRDVSVISFSGGFRAARSQILNNGMEDRVTALILLDSLYQDRFFDEWLKRNITDLATGRKIYHNYYFDTARNSLVQMERIRRMLSETGIQNARFLHDPDHPGKVLPASASARYGILFKRSTIYTQRHHAHANMVNLYFPISLKALSLREQPKVVASQQPAASI